MKPAAQRLNRIRCAQALTPEGWCEYCVIELAASGRITAVVGDDGKPVDLNLNGTVIPGMPNLHSHAHQRAIAGLTEHKLAGHDDFWGWRERMYRANARLGPDELQAVARYVYSQMLQNGYTTVAEFHYLHHDPAGNPYADPAEMSARLLEAASEAGIAITLLPVLYCRGGFSGQAVQGVQKRFFSLPDHYLELVQACALHCADDPDRALGFAAHSLRAVAPEVLTRTLQDAGNLAAGVPVHIHVAEQQKEVVECRVLNGRTPIAWLHEICPVDQNWCLVHATHAEPDELRSIVESDATVGLCPTTEANLGDGVFPTAEFLQSGGCFGIGSDSQVCTAPSEELKLLEYAQRLSLQRRTVLVKDDEGSVGRSLVELALAGGNRALGEGTWGLVPGARADLLELDNSHADLAALSSDQVLDSWIFAGSRTGDVSNVIVGGQHVVVDGVHALLESAALPFQQVVATLNDT